MITVVKVTKTCSSFPAQWEGTTDDGQRVYARYRHGLLRVGVGQTITDAIRAGGNVFPVTRIVEDPYHGQMNFHRLKALTREVITWPETEEQTYPEEERAMTTHTKKYGIYHWDTFDNETLLIAEADTQDEAVSKVEDHYKGRIAPNGADQVDIVDHDGNVVRSFSVR